MLHTTLEHVKITRKNCAAIREEIVARDQRREVTIGDQITHYWNEEFDDKGISITIWHNRERAAVCQVDADSEWGDWNEREQIIILDEPDEQGQTIILNRFGEPLL